MPVDKKRASVAVTLPMLAEKHRTQVPISMVTAYDYATAKCAHEASAAHVASHMQSMPMLLGGR